MTQLMEFVNKVYKKVNEHDCFGLSAEIAYQSLFSIFPFLLLLVSIAGLVGKFFGIPTHFFSIIYDFVPPVAIDLINKMILDVIASNSLEVFSFGLLFTLWAGSAAMDSLIKAFDRIYEVEESRPFLRRKLFSMVLLIIAVFLFIASTLLVFIGDMILAMMGGNILFLQMLQLVGIFTLVTLNVLLLNGFAPNVTIPLHKLLHGAVFFSLIWILTTYLFKFYVRAFGRYSVTYGSIGGIIVLMTWVYFTAFLLLLGAVINSIAIDWEK